MRTLAIALLTCAFALAADSPFVGTWMMNKAESNLDPNGPQYDRLSVQFIQDGPTLKSVIMTNGKTAPPAIIDGTQQPMSDNAGPSLFGATHYVATFSGRTIETVLKKDGKIVGTRKTILSANGKVMTAVTDGTSPTGQKVHWTVVFDKQ